MFKLTEQSRRRHLKRFPLYALLAIALWSLGIGWGMTQAFNLPAALDIAPQGAIAQTSGSLQAAKDIYVDTCSECHIALPPEVLPTQAWKRLLEKPQDHYGTSITGMLRLTQLLMWNYLQTYSRPLSGDAPIPFYVERSRFFKILHPRVEFTEPITHQSCLRCHPGVGEFDYRTLTPEWFDAP